MRMFDSMRLMVDSFQCLNGQRVAEKKWTTESSSGYDG